MSLLTTVRITGRHRAKTPAQLKAELDQLTCLVMRRTTERDTALAAVNERDRAMAKAVDRIATLEETLRRFDAERAEAKGEVRRLTADLTALRATVQPRDVSRPEDQATEPVDVRKVRAEFDDDYLDRTRQTWIGPVTRVLPLFNAPLAAVTNPGDITSETTVTLPVPLAS